MINIYYYKALACDEHHEELEMSSLAFLITIDEDGKIYLDLQEEEEADEDQAPRPQDSNTGSRSPGIYKDECKDIKLGQHRAHGPSQV
jgi:predicted RNA-binding protein with RPS1 domain